MAATRADRTARLSARDLIGSTVSSSVERLIGELPRARAGQEPEGVHQARVATRRLRSDLRTFAPLLDETWRVQMRAELRRLTDALGAVRDADVLTAQLHEVLRASDLAMRMTTEVVQLLGGYGYCREYRAERLMRDAKITQIWEGTNQIHRQLIGRSLIRK